MSARLLTYWVTYGVVDVLIPEISVRMLLTYLESRAATNDYFDNRFICRQSFLDLSDKKTKSYILTFQWFFLNNAFLRCITENCNLIRTIISVSDTYNLTLTNHVEVSQKAFYSIFKLHKYLSVLIQNMNPFSSNLSNINYKIILIIHRQVNDSLCSSGGFRVLKFTSLYEALQLWRLLDINRI